MVTGPMEEDCSRDRSDGYMRALKEAGLTEDLSMIIEGDWSATSGQDALLSLAEQGRLPGAIFAQNDRMALGILHTARDMGINVPEQLAVIGVDDMPLASYFDPPLTTMHQDMPRIGREAMLILVDTINKTAASCTQMKLMAKLIARQSTLRKGGD
jgi:DNA-binding LacI/PurR family transcriptional regulator